MKIKDDAEILVLILLAYGGYRLYKWFNSGAAGGLIPFVSPVTDLTNTNGEAALPETESAPLPEESPGSWSLAPEQIPEGIY